MEDTTQRGTPVQVTRNGGVFAAESVDGPLYYSKLDVPGIWKMPLQGGKENPHLDQPAGDDWYNWALARNGIYFPIRVSRTNATVSFLTSQRARRFPSPPRTNHLVWVALISRRRSILYVQGESAESSIMLVRTFSNSISVWVLWRPQMAMPAALHNGRETSLISNRIVYVNR